MTRQEIENRIEELETNAFYINMADRLSRSDWEALDKIYAELRNLRAQLREME